MSLSFNFHQVEPNPIVLKKLLTENSFAIITGLAAAASSVLIRKAIDKTIEKKTGKKAPLNPNHKDYKLKDVLIYSAATALAGATAKVLVRHLTTKEWKRLDGDTPEDIE